MLVDAVTQKVQLTFAPFQEPFALVQLLESLAHRLVQTLDLMADRGGLKICANQVELSAPTRCVASDCDALLVALSHARCLAKIDLLAEARADETARVPHQGPADRRGSLPEMMDVLLGHVRVVPNHFFLEASRRSVMLERADVCANNPFEGLKHGSRSNAFHGISPVGALAEVHRVVIPVGEPEPDRYASGRLETQRIDQLLP